MRRFIYCIQAGGVEATISSAFDEDVALKREKEMAFIKMGRELEEAGYVTVTSKVRGGDYTKQFVVLTFPEKSE